MSSIVSPGGHWPRLFNETSGFSKSLEDSHIPWIPAVVALLLSYYVLSIISLRKLGPNVPLVGIQSLFETRLITNWRFFKNGASVVKEGYNKYKGVPYRLARNDADIIILPKERVEELRMLPFEVANPTSAHVHNLLGPHTKMDIILGSNLHFRTIQNKLTPNLASLTPLMEEEVRYGLEQEDQSNAEDWVTIHPYHFLLRLVSRVSARVFVGFPFCRDDRWLEASVQFTENIFISVCFLRLLPPWTHGIVKYFLPSIWRGSSYIRTAKRLLGPEIARKYAARTSLGQDSKSDQEQATLLSWMMDTATGSEASPEHLAHLEIVISLASIHTSQMNAVHVLYDLAAHPQYLSAIREEIMEAAAAPGGWNKTSYARLRKIDSFLKESQRLNPPSVLSMHRVMQQDHVLSDGTKLPKGAHVAMPVNAIQNDAEVMSDADDFDPFRYSKLREDPRKSHMHQFATTDATHLNFGHGKYSCPGRFFAALEIKTILVPLIMNYDFKLVEEGKRPQNLAAHEFIFPNPAGELLMKSRGKNYCPF